jgi:hypothetical protein
MTDVTAPNAQVGPNHGMGRYYYSLGSGPDTVDGVTVQPDSGYCSGHTMSLRIA